MLSIWEAVSPWNGSAGGSAGRPVASASPMAALVLSASFWAESFREPIDDNYETEACGIPQLETVDLETLSLFKSRTDLACLRDLLNAKCFIGKAHNVVCDFCAWTIVSIYHMLTF